MLRLSVIVVLSFLTSVSAAQPVHLSASAGFTSLGPVGGPGPSAGVAFRLPVGRGRAIAAMRFDATAIDRTRLAEDYQYDDPSATCRDGGSGEEVDVYFCAPLSEGSDVLGAYSIEAAYAPPLSVGLALGVGLRYGEIVDPAAGKEARLQPFALGTIAVPVTRRIAVEGRTRGGVDLWSAHLGVSLSL